MRVPALGIAMLVALATALAPAPAWPEGFTMQLAIDRSPRCGNGQDCGALSCSIEGIIPFETIYLTMIVHTPPGREFLDPAATINAGAIFSCAREADRSQSRKLGQREGSVPMRRAIT